MDNEPTPAQTIRHEAAEAAAEILRGFDRTSEAAARQVIELAAWIETGRIQPPAEPELEDDGWEAEADALPPLTEQERERFRDNAWVSISGGPVRGLGTLTHVAPLRSPFPSWRFDPDTVFMLAAVQRQGSEPSRRPGDPLNVRLTARVVKVAGNMVPGDDWVPSAREVAADASAALVGMDLDTGWAFDSIRAGD